MTTTEPIVNSLPDPTRSGTSGLSFQIGRVALDRTDQLDGHSLRLGLSGAEDELIVPVGGDGAREVALEPAPTSACDL